MTRTGHIHYLQRQKDLEQTTHNCNRSTGVAQVPSALAPASRPCCLQRGSSMKAQQPSASTPLSPGSDSRSISTAARICSGLSTAGPAPLPAAQHGTPHPGISSCRSRACSVIQSPSSAAVPRTRCPWCCLGPGASDTGWPRCLQCQLEFSACHSGTKAFGSRGSSPVHSPVPTALLPTAHAPPGLLRARDMGICTCIHAA